jgi:glycosyltransferase involved in cell wall biosynthesis
MNPRLAFLGPLPPARTGVATYDASVLDGLRRIGFMDRHRLDVLWPLEPKHEGTVPWYALGVYQLGNNVEFHRDVYRFACEAPGLIVLHDLALDDFTRGMVVGGDPLGFVATREAARLRDRLRSPDILRNEPLRDPWCAHVARRARGIIVHSDFCRRYLEELGCRTPVFVVPHPAIESVSDMRGAERRARSLRSPLESQGARIVIGALGDLNEAKRLDAVLSAVGRLPNDVHVVLVGRRIEGYDVGAVVARRGLGDRTHLHTDVSDEEFRAWLYASDVVVDLRFPHRGEVSGTLTRAMQAGRPTVVSATGTYLDVPDDLVVRVLPGPPNVEELAATLAGLADDGERRARIGSAAAAHMERLARTDASATGYANAIEETLSLVRDPVRVAMARWGGSLVDVGVDEEAIEAGYGLSYARAFDDFTRSS